MTWDLKYVKKMTKSAAKKMERADANLAESIRVCTYADNEANAEQVRKHAVEAVLAAHRFNGWWKQLTSWQNT